MRGRQGIDFGEWDKGFDITSWIEVALSKLRNGGSIVIFCSWWDTGDISNALKQHGCLVKELLFWKKSNPMPRNRDRLYVTSCEIAIWATKGKGWTFNRQRDTYENAVFEYPVVSHKQRYHPTQKSQPLFENLILIHSNEGDIVLDPFMGSGTTAAACINTGRNYIGFELDSTYYDGALERIKAGR